MRGVLKNKGGGFKLIGEDVVDTIFAAIGILILAFLAVLGYLYISDANKAKQAKEILEGSEGIVTAINAGKLQFDKDIPNPAGWSLFGFSSATKPNSCLGKKCLCICARANFFQGIFNANAQLKQCDKAGFCSAVPNLKEDLEIKIEKGKLNSIHVFQINDEVSITKKAA
jgi:hypothetical protein